MKKRENPLYNTCMRTVNPQTLTVSLTRQTEKIWDTLCEIRPKLVRFNPPKIELNNRLWRCAGMAYQEKNVVNLATKFFLFSAQYANQMESVILPHEIIHIADYKLYGLSEKKCGHGENWRTLMLEYGLPDNPFHSMFIPQSFHIKPAK